ncbi:hypothetical protein BBJ29_008721 [Phytophthora kernoviae]|uniref:Uncharacterized protein n=1 Tax=Phytophthora kernoviae TaxID=325452 RepID=A0A3F2RDK4_9STRA|nr:hypothetical protein BBJ29_008721 [Phytophthora kernoviae]RLN53994.1 hypothetical protein BBP00_00009101 [Phytophthora kernoviae]
MPTNFNRRRSVNTNDLDIPKWQSFASGASHPKDVEKGYAISKTTEHAPIGALPTGAIREGGMSVLTSKDNLGLLFQYAIVGLVYGLLPETIYPFMQEWSRTISSPTFCDITYAGRSPVQDYMVGVTPINSTLSDILSNLLFMFGIMITSKWEFH